MRIYYSAPAQLLEKFRDEYERVLSVLKRDGNEVWERVKIMADEEYENCLDDNKQVRYSEVIKRIDEADLAVVDVSYPSLLNSGVEVSLLIERKKPVLIMCKEGCVIGVGLQESVVAGKTIVFLKYSTSNLETVLLDAIGSMI